MPPATATPERGADGKFIKTADLPARTTDDKQQAAPAEKRPDEKKPEKKPETDTPEVTEWMEDWITGRKVPGKAKESKPAEVEKADDGKPAEKKPEEKPAAAAPAKAKPVAKPVELTAESIAKAVGEGVATAMKGKEEKKPDAKPADPDADLSDLEKRKVVVLRFMEQRQPDKYKGIADKYKSNLKLLSDYADKWEKENPGQTFDDDAEEHTEFFEKNKLYQPWDDEDYTDAKAEMIAEKKVAEATAETNKKLSVLEREKKALEARPQVDRHQTVAAREYWKKIGGEFDGIVAENGAVDNAKMKALQENNPDIFAKTLESAQRLDTLVESAYLLKKGLIDFNEKNPAHAYLAEFALSKEKELASRPLEQQVNEAGQQFKPANEYFAIKKEDRERFWTFNEGDLAALLASDESRKMKTYITSEEEKLARWAKAKGLVPKESLLEEKEEKTDDGDAKQKLEQAQAENDLEQEQEEAGHSPASTASPKSATILDEGKNKVKQPEWNLD